MSLKDKEYIADGKEYGCKIFFNEDVAQAVKDFELCLISVDHIKEVKWLLKKYKKEFGDFSEDDDGSR